MPPPRVYRQLSRSGVIRRPCIQTSSPTLTTAVISWGDSPGPTAGKPSASLTPSRNRAPPTPPTSTVTLTERAYSGREIFSIAATTSADPGGGARPEPCHDRAVRGDQEVLDVPPDVTRTGRRPSERGVRSTGLTERRVRSTGLTERR